MSLGKFVKKGVYFFGGFIGLNIIYLGTLLGLQAISSPERITQENYSSVLKREKEKLNISDKNIELKLFEGETYSNSTMSTIGRKDTLYLIYLSGRFKDVYSLRHELYHIADEHFLRDKKIDNLNLSSNTKRIIKSVKEEYIDDFEATLYSLTGIKL